MFEVLWREFVDIKIAEEYYFLYVHHSRCWLIGINGLCLVASLTGVVTLVSSILPPLLSSIVILVPQIVSVLQPFYPHGDRLYAGRLIHAELKKPALLAEQTINQYLYGSLDDNGVTSALAAVRSSLVDVESKFASADLFRRNKSLHRKAQRNVKKYVKVHFNSEE